MRIEVNLLPGAKRGRRKKGGASIDFKKLGEAIAAKFKDFYLSTAVASGIVAVAVIGLLFMVQRGRAANLDAEVTKQAADSARFSVVLQDRARARKPSATAR